MKKVLIACQCSSNKGDRAIAEYLISQLEQYNDINVVLSTTDVSLWNMDNHRNVKVIGAGYRHLHISSKYSLVNRIIRQLEFLFYRYLCFGELIYRKESAPICKYVSSKFVNEIKNSDLVIVTGGHHITSIRNKNALFAITYDIALISLYARKYVLWSQTIGPLEFTNTRVKSFFKKILIKAETIYLRDNNSFDCVKTLYGEMGNLRKSYDSVFGYGDLKFDNYDERKNRIGISIFNGLEKAKKTYPYIIDLLNYCVDKGYEVYFFRMEYDDKELSDIKNIIKSLKPNSKVTIYPFESSTIDHLSILASCKCYIGYKTHSVIMSLTTATPLVGICYHKKTRDFMSDFGLQDDAIDDNEIKDDILIKMFNKVISRTREIHRVEFSKSIAISNSLRMDFHDMIERNLGYNSHEAVEK